MTTEETTLEPQAEGAEDTAEPQAEAEQVLHEVKADEPQLDEEWEKLTADEKVNRLAAALGQYAAAARPAEKVIVIPEGVIYTVEHTTLPDGRKMMVLKFTDQPRNETYAIRFLGTEGIERFGAQVLEREPRVDVFGPEALAGLQAKRQAENAHVRAARRR